MSDFFAKHEMGPDQSVWSFSIEVQARQLPLYLCLNVDHAPFSPPISNTTLTKDTQGHRRGHVARLGTQSAPWSVGTRLTVVQQ